MKIRECIDDFCSSIPFIISPNNTEENSVNYPHEPGDAIIPKDPGGELIASMSQLKSTLVVGSQVDCVALSQRQEIRAGPKERAMNLEPTCVVLSAYVI